MMGVCSGAHPCNDSSLLLATRPVACDFTMAALTSISPGRKKMMKDCVKQRRCQHCPEKHRVTATAKLDSPKRCHAQAHIRECCRLKATHQNGETVGLKAHRSSAADHVQHGAEVRHLRQERDRVRTQQRSCSHAQGLLIDRICAVSTMR